MTFYEMYGAKTGKLDYAKLNILDKWILAKLQILVQEATLGMENYDMSKSSRPIVAFIAELSQWYVRRSRDRFKEVGTEGSLAATAVLREVLLTLSKVIAPFTPFIAEKIYLGITQGKEKESVHLESWPKVNQKLMDEQVLKGMDLARKVVEMGLSLRAENSLKVRQPLTELIIEHGDLEKGLLEIVADELNVKTVKLGEVKGGAVKEEGELRVALDLEVTIELKKEGLVREITRTINQMRKEQKLTVNDLVIVEYSTADSLLQSVFQDFAGEIKKSILAKDLVASDSGMETEIDGKKVKIKIVK
jgi:isoleucyl-tRNA synthetase